MSGKSPGTNPVKLSNVLIALPFAAGFFLVGQYFVSGSSSQLLAGVGFAAIGALAIYRKWRARS